MRFVCLWLDSAKKMAKPWFIRSEVGEMDRARAFHAGKKKPNPWVFK